MPDSTRTRTRADSVRRGALAAAALVVVAGLPLGAAILAAAPPGAAPAPCATVQLATLGGTQGNALAVSSNGLVVGWAEDSTGTPQPVLWQNGQAQRIDTGLTNVSPAGVNSRGEVIGLGVTPGEPTQVGWQWTGGRTTILQSPPGTIAVPSAISDTGLIVGALASDDDGDAAPTSGEAPERAASWASANAPAVDLPSLPGDVGGHAFGVNSQGVIVGSSQATDHFTPVLWAPGGRVFALPMASSRWGIARTVDDTGLVVGDVAVAGGSTETVTWDPARAQRRHGTGGGKGTEGRGLVHGRAVGQIQVRGSDDVDRSHAVLWDAGSGTQPLPPLPGDRGAGVNAASGNSGVVAGYSSDVRDLRRPVTWTCGA
jgi:probable HAF family extracellular repeat protein